MWVMTVNLNVCDGHSTSYILVLKNETNNMFSQSFANKTLKKEFVDNPD